jgi:hypothetical protein
MLLHGHVLMLAPGAVSRVRQARPSSVFESVAELLDRLAEIGQRADQPARFRPAGAGG